VGKGDRPEAPRVGDIGGGRDERASSLGETAGRHVWKETEPMSVRRTGGKLPSILALIPARSGSKSVRDKNIRVIAGKPLLAYSIESALASRLIGRIIVSTDSPQYADIAREYGAEVPFLRPSAAAGDLSTDLEVFAHALDWLKEEEGYVPEICVHLRPTYPVRDTGDIDAAIEMLLRDPDADSVRSIAPSPFTPFKMWFLGKDGLLSPVVSSAMKEPYNLPRQLLPSAYAQNACIDVVRTTVITQRGSMSGNLIRGFVMKENLDIDDEAQLREAGQRLLAETSQGPLPGTPVADPHEKMRLCFDIDGVIASIVPGNRYEQAQPNRDVIDLVNRLYGQGHHIILFTARGSATGIDWTETTRRQMAAWGVRHHELLFGKPAADYYIDDRLVSVGYLRTLVGRSRAIPSGEGDSSDE